MPDLPLAMASARTPCGHMKGTNIQPHPVISPFGDGRPPAGYMRTCAECGAIVEARYESPLTEITRAYLLAHGVKPRLADEAPLS